MTPRLLHCTTQKIMVATKTGNKREMDFVEKKLSFVERTKSFHIFKCMALSYCFMYKFYLLNENLTKTLNNIPFFSSKTKKWHLFLIYRKTCLIEKHNLSIGRFWESQTQVAVWYRPNYLHLWDPISPQWDNTINHCYIYHCKEPYNFEVGVGK